MSFTKYRTKEGDRWDTISQKAYGTPFNIKQLIAANPRVPIFTELKGGVEIFIPVIELEIIKKSNLPPWKN